LSLQNVIRLFFGKGPQEGRDIDRLMKKYGTNRAYTEHYWRHIVRNHKDNPLFDSYLESELGSLNRSRDYIRALCDHFDDKDLFQGKECLDIGCSSGNSLIAFMESGAARAVGIEVSPGRYETALLNTGGCPEAIRSGVQLLNADVQTIDPGQVGRCDVIFCNSVLEHVSNPDVTIRKICLLMKDLPRAFAFVKIWNYQYPKTVLHEPHYDLPGLTLLPYELAKDYYLHCRKDSGIDYEVYHWHDHDYYQARFTASGKNCGLYAATEPTPAKIDCLCLEAAGLLELFEETCSRYHISGAMRLEIRPYLETYLSEISERVETCRRTGSQEVIQAFWHRYGMHVMDMIITNRQETTRN
jgi:2-polyprenyl-3-methyl-5-hydroxy-6-metoxy-1,4-benzoquinol methylase